MYQVPRKTYRDFHSDIFPETNGFRSELSPKDWLSGKNLPLEKISLDPAKREAGEKPIIVSFALSKVFYIFSLAMTFPFLLTITQQILRGSLKDVVSNMNNSAKNLNDLAKPITKQSIFPSKNKIQLMELDQEKRQTESAEFMQKHKTITCQKLIENFEEEPKIVEVTAQNTKNSSHCNDTNGDHLASLNNGKVHSDIPPKPLPRKSISEQGSFEENSSILIPKPRPRMACGNFNYKVYFYKYNYALFSPGYFL